MAGEEQYQGVINKTVTINAPVSTVWDSLTNPDLIKRWMSDTAIHVISDWKTGSPIIFRGNLHWIDFENRGVIQAFEPGKTFQYTSWSSLSELPDSPENYSVFRFELTPVEDKTMVQLTISRFATEIIYKHLNFYWTVALELLKKACEQE
jgi:uncharacterized protein YndB with AHSA1/START domain